MRALSPFERALFWFFVLLFLGSAVTLIARANALILVDVPSSGGSIVEGVIGSPRFINPLLAISDPDRDLSALVYSGLMTIGEDGALEPDLAESYEISEDGRTYTFTLKEDAVFHDGTPVTVDDVLYTVAMTQDPIVKSPKRASWDGVIAEKIDERRISFTLPQPYTPFLYNTTLGILPKHLWESVSAEQFPFSQLNIEPVGSGPFKVRKIERSDSGLPLFYELSAFDDYALGKPYLKRITINFYPNEERLIAALKDGKIQAVNSISPQAAQELEQADVRIETRPLPRIFGAFFNQNRAAIFTDESIREALTLAAPKEQILSDVLFGYGEIIDSPIPAGLLGTAPAEPEAAYAERLEEARALLEADGWERDEESGVLMRESDEGVETLSFSISTSNTPELKAVAGLLAESWRSLGASVETRFFETSDLNQNVIRSRDYDVLLFGEIVGRELDLFSFWHSSQRNDPGLNIALYANITTDKLLADARTSTDPEEIAELYREFEDEIRADTPAVFLYSPLFIYAVPDELSNLNLGPVTTSGERFSNVHEWYIETEKIWPIFR